jgi:hypothetical protein
MLYHSKVLKDIFKGEKGIKTIEVEYIIHLLTEINHL